MPHNLGQTGRLTDQSIANNMKLIDLSNEFYKIKLELEDAKLETGESEISAEFFDTWDFKDRFVIFEQLGEYKLPVIRKIFVILESMGLLQKHLLPNNKVRYSFLNKDKLVELFKIAIASIHPDFLTPARVLEIVYESLKLNKSVLLSENSDIDLQYPINLLEGSPKFEIPSNVKDILMNDIKSYINSRNLKIQKVSINVINLMFTDPLFTGHLKNSIDARGSSVSLEEIKWVLIRKLLDNSLESDLLLAA